jgi:hypothetical protein
MRAPNTLPGDWLAPPRFAVPEPDFASFDRPNTLFVTDRAPDPAPKSAGVCGSGGAAVPGPIGVDKGRYAVWDGARLVDGEPAPDGWVLIERAAEDRIRRIAEVWAESRGLPLHPTHAGPNPEDDAVLSIYGFPPLKPHPCEVARDGWSAAAESSGPLTARDEFGALEPWLATIAGEVVVARAPGRVHVALTSIGEPRGDPAAWAVSWSQLLDDSRALPRGCVTVRERSAAGDPLTRDPLMGDANEVDSIGPWTAIAAGIAALFALGAAGLGLSSARERFLAVP